MPENSSFVKPILYFEDAQKQRIEKVGKELSFINFPIALGNQTSL